MTTPFAGLEETALLLEQTPLAGAALSTVAFKRSADVGIQVDYSMTELDHFAAWAVARGLLSQTRRWPVVSGVEMPQVAAVGTPEEGDRLLERANSVSDAQVASSLAAEWNRVYDDRIREETAWVASRIRNSEHIIGETANLDDLIADLGPLEALTLRDVERWLYEWENERAEGAVPGPEQWDQTERIYSPGPVLHLLPVEAGWQLPKIIDWLEFDHDDVASRGEDEPMRVDTRLLLATTLRRWEQRYGAEVWVHDWAELKFRVARPPDTADAVWDLIPEHGTIFNDRQLLEGMFETRNYARALLGSDRWNLMSF